jgi:hypothetical protein
MELHNLDKHESDTKEHAKRSHTPNHFPPLLIACDQHDDKSSESIERCTDAEAMQRDAISINAGSLMR